MYQCWSCHNRGRRLSRSYSSKETAGFQIRRMVKSCPWQQSSPEGLLHARWPNQARIWWEMKLNGSLRKQTSNRPSVHIRYAKLLRNLPHNRSTWNESLDHLITVLLIMDSESSSIPFCPICGSLIDLTSIIEGFVSCGYCKDSTPATELVKDREVTMSKVFRVKKHWLEDENRAKGKKRPTMD